MAICSKFGISGLGVAVGAEVGAGVCVGNEVDVGKRVTVGIGAKTVGSAAGTRAQAARNSRTKGVRKSFVFIQVDYTARC